ncbi:hypothetical protein SSP35_09_01110 [Streptomyces sp. NBRC 110611]|uniref:hypothetical protein n=1 Tax=Streptomyces sp. NBRC 110611 TaxID=1621259 RepID=UPI000835D22D|nr:hypothetical protein [Streptomyces sp. NBRC 110611]GAU68868.1 hypothetical protein SSP35_09_01110 [Streptomyces sp. NBRC 110611]
MNANQQHMLDAYRAAQRGEQPPAAPGVHTVRTAREIRGWLRFRAVVREAFRTSATATATPAS